MAFEEPTRHRTSISLELATAKEKPELPEQLICGEVSRVNPDEPVAVTVIESVKGLASLPIEGVISMKAGPLLKLLVEHQELFGVKLVVLRGYPNAQYTPEFDQLLWGVDRAAYEELIAEIVTATRVDNARKEQAGARQKSAKREMTLTRERTRHFDDFKRYDVTEPTDDAGA